MVSSLGLSIFQQSAVSKHLAQRLAWRSAGGEDRGYGLAGAACIIEADFVVT